MAKLNTRKARACLCCAVVFVPDHGNAKMCSVECKHERNVTRTREYLRKVRKTAPTKFAENRDPVAILERRRERYRRGQAARRARLKCAR